MTSQIKNPPIDVLMCVGPRDVGRLFPYSLQSCVNRFECLNNIVIVTPVKNDVLNVLSQNKAWLAEANIVVLDDHDVLSERLLEWPSWCKQQVIKLHADTLCTTPVVACLGADTIIFNRINASHLFSDSAPILYYNRYTHTSKHLAYERCRVEHVARLLRVPPTRSWELGDFIMDFMLFESARLRELREYLGKLYGSEAFFHILPKQCDTIEQKVVFGEWTLYAVFLLDVLNARVPVQNSDNRFIAQVHSENELNNFHFNASAVHFVDKSIDLSRVIKIIEECDRSERTR